MEIAKCKFCKAYITKFEIHHCFKFGNQHRKTSSTIPQCSSGNLAENIELITAEERVYEARWPSLGQSISSTHQSILPDIHQEADYEDTAVAEMPSQYGMSNQIPLYPEVPDFLFPDMPHIEENKPTPIHLQLSSEGAFPQIECPGISRTNDVSSHFSSACHTFSLISNILTSETSQYSGISLETQISKLQNSQNTSKNLNPPTTSIEETETSSFTILTCDDPSDNLLLSTNSLCSSREGNISNTSETEKPNYIIDAISLPSTSHDSKENQEYRVINVDALKFKQDENSPKHKEFADFSCGTAENFSNPSNETQILQYNFGIGINSNKIEARASERSGLVNCSSESHKACNISTTSLVNERHSTYKNHQEDMIFNRNANSANNLNSPSGNAEKRLNKYCKDRKSYLQQTEHPEFRNRSTVSRHYSKNFDLKRHILNHAGEEASKCDSCGEEFSSEESLGAHKCKEE
ncbi:hypothetical protein CDAR_369631 [Caerostris darwini]|uniref:C2H2-type domain-containing protein n=1 Tax=Caerostris darwini TaxID=1538125 RepID=A0AAV4V2W5_9ARAC|nr:hypothetical protein CDAR_369631 [Caerostris darwini]